MFKGVAGGAAGSLFDFGLQALGNAVLPMSRAQQQQNAFASSEARAARDFSAQQAEINRDWQEDMYARYNSLQGKVAQANEAGVNPLFAVTGSATSPMSAAPSSVAAPAASPSSASPVGQLSDMVGATLGFSKLSAEIENIRSVTRNQNAQALKTELDSLWVDKINSQTIKESNRRIQSADVSDAEKVANTNLLIEKVFTEKSTQAEKAQNVLVLASEVKKNEAEMGLILARVVNMDADTNYKAALTAGALISNSANERYLARLMASDLNLNIKEAQKLSKEMRQMVLDYGHDKLMYGFQEIIAGQQAGEAYSWDANSPAYEDKPVMQRIIRTINALERLVDFSASTVDVYGK